ncbi:MAG: desulfoferrodoxin [Bacteroidales bacterium]|nr:desulfoferrodoxin [Bacteroidales bacterium]
MTQKNELYKCEICGNIIEVKHTGSSTLVCCGQKMKLRKENTTDAATEKHVPVITKLNDGYKVVVGEVEHPMTEDHYIEWIQLLTENTIYTKYLNPDESPEAIFKTDADEITVRAYCNLHGNWKNNN